MAVAEGARGPGGCRAAWRHSPARATRPRRRRPCGALPCRRSSTARRVEREPGDERALGEMDADVRRARACRHVPVDLADVVLAGWYGRIWASSLPRPSSSTLWSPGSRPSTRRAIERSSARSRGSGHRPARAERALCPAERALRSRGAAREVELRRRERREDLVQEAVGRCAARRGPRYESTMRWRSASLISSWMSWTST